MEGLRPLREDRHDEESLSFWARDSVLNRARQTRHPRALNGTPVAEAPLPEILDESKRSTTYEFANVDSVPLEPLFSHVSKTWNAPMNNERD